MRALRVTVPVLTLACVAAACTSGDFAGGGGRQVQQPTPQGAAPQPTSQPVAKPTRAPDGTAETPLGGSTPTDAPPQVTPAPSPDIVTPTVTAAPATPTPPAPTTPAWVIGGRSGAAVTGASPGSRWAWIVTSPDGWQRPGSCTPTSALT